MADKKISALTAATLPLAGTEVLPIVQSSTTKKVATDDLTVKNIRSNATTGLLQVAGPGVGTTRIMTVPDANFTTARTDAANSFTGDQTLSTGNIIQGTAAKGLNFTANTPSAGKTSQLMNWYEEGTWTPALTYTSPGTLSVSYATRLGWYTRVGRMVNLTGIVRLSAFTKGTASGTLSISGVPFTAANLTDALWIGDIATYSAPYTNIPKALMAANGTSILLLQIVNNGDWTSMDDPDANSQYIITINYYA